MHASGVLELLDSHGVPLEGAEAVVVGRSDLVGKPVAAMLLARNATVTMCHSRTRDLAGVCARADVLIAAVGVPELIGAEHVKDGAVVIDVGMNRTDDGLKGDVDFEATSASPADHAGTGRRRADDDRDAARQHGHGGAAAGRRDEPAAAAGPLVRGERVAAVSAGAARADVRIQVVWRRRHARRLGAARGEPDG